MVRAHADGLVALGVAGGEGRHLAAPFAEELQRHVAQPANADHAHEAEARKARGFGDPDPRGVGGELAFGGADIGAAAEQRLGIAHRDRRRGQRRRRRRRQHLIDRAGRLPGEHRKRVHIGFEFGGERQALGVGAVGLVAQPLDIERRGDPAVITLLGQRQHLALHRRGALRQRDALLPVAQIDIGLGDLGGEAHLGIGEIGRRRLDHRARRLDRTAMPAEQINLPARVETDIVEVQPARAAARCAVLALAEIEARYLGMGVDALHIRARQAVGALLPQRGARLPQPRLRHRDIGIGRERALLERIERRIAQRGPPRAERRRCRARRIAAAYEGLGRRRGRRRAGIIRPDGAGGQRQRGQQQRGETVHPKGPQWVATGAPLSGRRNSASGIVQAIPTARIQNRSL